MISFLIFFPLVAAAALAFGGSQRTMYMLALAASVVELGVAVALLLNITGSGYFFGERAAWAQAIGLSYGVAADSISAWLIVLTAALTFVALAASYSIADRAPQFYALLLALEAALVGTFASTNILLFYIFFEIMLIPSYFLIAGWGGKEANRAAVRFLIYTFFGSLLMLAAILSLAFLTTPANGTPDLTITIIRDRLAAGVVDSGVQHWLFAAFALAFAVKVPLVPFHSWQADAYTHAPTPMTVMLSGAMSKTGAYGFLRFGVLLFPASVINDFAPYLAGLAAFSIIYGALVALVQRDLKRLLAYSSLSHLGFIVLGIFALNVQGVNGAVLQMVNHGVTTPALFLAVAALEARTGSRDLSALGGLGNFYPRFMGIFVLFALASLGLPGLNQFAGEFLILGGAFLASPVYAVVGVVGVVLAAWYMLRMVQGIWHGAHDIRASSAAQTADLRPAEWLMFGGLAAAIILLGLFPSIVTGLLDPTVRALLRA